MNYINPAHIISAQVLIEELEVHLQMSNGTLIVIDGSKEALVKIGEELPSADHIIKLSDDLNMYFRKVTTH